MLAAPGEHGEVLTDRETALARVVAELFPGIPGTFDNTEKHANNLVECDHGRLAARLWTMRGLKTDQTASVIIHGHAFVQNLRRGHYGLGADSCSHHLRGATASNELAEAI